MDVSKIIGARPKKVVSEVSKMMRTQGASLRKIAAVLL